MKFGGIMRTEVNERNINTFGNNFAECIFKFVPYNN